MKEKKVLTVAQQKQRKFYLALPILVIPFITLGFYALGGGKGGNHGITVQEGFNSELPNASDKNMKEGNKLEMYARATKDSIERSRQLKNDPYGLEFTDQTGMDEEGIEWTHPSTKFNYSNGSGTQHHEKKILEQLDALNQALMSSENTEDRMFSNSAVNPATTYSTLELDRLEQMMEMMNAETSTGDPEMEQINKTLETILDIQHPERVQERLQRISKENLGQVYAVASAVAPVKIGLLESDLPTQNENYSLTSPTNKGSGFFGLMDDAKTDEDIQNAIEAVVHENQVVVSGSTVKLRLVSEIFINGKRIPAGSFVYGIASLKGERLEIAIESIRSENNLFPVALTVHDLDGLSGIRIPGAIARDVAKQSGAQTVSGISPTMFDPSIGAQVASAGIELSKNLLSKKIKLIKVEVKAGYQVLLRDKKQK